MTEIVQVAQFAPTTDAHGRRDAWAAPQPVEIDGWAPANDDTQPIEGNRRPITADREVYPLTVAGGPRARWTFPDGVFEQIGHASVYSNGPWWRDGAAVVIQVRRVEG